MLKFDLYFQEPVVEDPNENYRVRKCILFYYLEDDTIHIIESRVENSGIPQGIFLKRHLLPKPDAPTDAYTWRDLNLACDLNVYGRVFRIVDCDEFTKSHFANEGVQLNGSEAFPDDPFVHTRAMINMKQNPPDLAEHKNYIEVMLKGGRPNKNLKSFLDNDRKVLSFAVVWHDTSYDGGDKFFRFNFFLADQSVEVKEINKPNSGHYPFPMLLKRQRLAKSPVLTHCPGMNMRDVDYYCPEDLKCGTNVNIFGRTCLIYDADDFTKMWYQHHHNMTQTPVALRRPGPNVFYQAVPPYTGYGTEEDSMGSVIALQAKPPKFDMKKMFKQDMHILRFNSKLVSTEPDDEARTFIISFYCGDDTIQVYEVCDKNSGRIGGRFMERKKQKSPVTAAYYSERDFLIGRTVFLGGFKFMLVSADEYTEKYMEDNPEVFPEASLDSIVRKIKAPARNFASLQDYAVDLLGKLDKNGDKCLSFQEFTNGLRSLNIAVTNHEEHALMRRFDTNSDGKISMEEFYNCLAATF